jgi:predicted ATPase
MLKSWSIENFKPIVNSGELKLAPVTVLAGLNSSGKSSLLQSILMISQTLSSRVLDRPLLPNGPIVQLGTFEDILSELSNSRTLIIGFTFDMEGEELNQTSGQRAVTPKLEIRSAKIAANFQSAVSGNGSSSAVEAAKVLVESIFMDVEGQFRSVLGDMKPEVLFNDQEAEAQKISLRVRKTANSKLNQFLSNVNAQYRRLVPDADQASNYFGSFGNERSEAEKAYLIALSHFLPSRFIQKYNLEESYRQTMKSAVSLMFNSYYNENADIFKILSKFFEENVAKSDNYRRTLDEFCKKENILISDLQDKTFIEILKWYRRYIIFDEKDRDILNRFQELISENMAQGPLNLDISKGTEGLEVVVNDIRVETLEQAIGQIAHFFTSKIRYLGPLRADPQASQKFAPSSELDDVGAKGEYAAAVYDANQNASIQWYNPFSKQVEQDSLKAALNTWTRYLGVANQIKTNEEGQSGFSWQVIHKEGQKPLPLTAVGVGVSQILPILVMGLLAPHRTLLIVEQPELHLHPRVQARLGDFFVGLSKCKKQCLIETHSENLVNQLRYHIVQSGGQDKSDCIIYFVDQDEKGAAKFEPVEISPKGNILNWPEGFFDETMQQEDRITAESIKRRANVARNG